MKVTDELFEHVVEKYTPLMYKMINNKFVSGYEREDLFQECLMTLHTTMINFDDTKGAKFITYLHTSLRNMLVDLIRKNNKATGVELVFVDSNSAVIMNELYDDNKDSIEDVDTLNTIVNELLKMPRGEITYLHYIVGLTQTEISEMEGITKQRVNYLNKRNITKLKELYKNGGFTL